VKLSLFIIFFCLSLAKADNNVGPESIIGGTTAFSVASMGQVLNIYFSRSARQAESRVLWEAAYNLMDDPSANGMQRLRGFKDAMKIGNRVVINYTLSQEASRAYVLIKNEQWLRNYGLAGLEMEMSYQQLDARIQSLRRGDIDVKPIKLQVDFIHSGDPSIMRSNLDLADFHKHIREGSIIAAEAEIFDYEAGANDRAQAKKSRIIRNVNIVIVLGIMAFEGYAAFQSESLAE
jgi:hypothetical protein